MHPELAEVILKTCRSREREGDCPTKSLPSGELMEDCIIELGRQRDDAKLAALRTLAEAFKKFAPDLAHELAVRWEKSIAQQDAALADLLSVLDRATKETP
jgi:hypothetical protein